MKSKIGRPGGTNKGDMMEKHGPLTWEGAVCGVIRAPQSVGSMFFAFERTKAKLRLGSELKEAAC